MLVNIIAYVLEVPEHCHYNQFMDEQRFRNRVIEMTVIRAGDLLTHEGNPFVPTEFQMEALEGDLEEIGITDVLKVYRSARHDDKLTLLDGHKRTAVHPDQLWPVVILDLTDDEADTQIIFHNTLGQWTQTDAVKMDALLKKARMSNMKLLKAADRIHGEIAEQVAIALRASGDKNAPAKPKRQFDFDNSNVAAVKVVIPTGDKLGLVERAIKATGQRNRGEALAEICRFYLDENENAQ